MEKIMETYVLDAIDELRNVKKVARDRYAWPGGYELFITTKDGGCLCSACCRSEFRQIAGDSFREMSSGWRFDRVSSAAELESKEWVEEDLENRSLEHCDHCWKALNP